VHLGEADIRQVKEAGLGLTRDLNQYLDDEILSRFNIRSYLEIEFEKVFLRFFMPTIRGMRDRGRC